MTKIDILEEKLKTVSDNNKRADVLNQLSKEYLNRSPEKSLECAQQARALSQEMQNQIEEAEALNNIGAVYWRLSKYNEALVFLREALELGRNINAPKQIADSLALIGIIYSQMDRYEQALDHYFQAMAIFEKIDDKHGIARLTNNIALIYDRWENYMLEREYLNRALELFEEIDHQHGVSKALGNIGNTYFYEKNYEKALEYHERSRLIREDLNDKSGIAGSLNNLAIIHGELGNQEKSLAYHKNALAIFEELRDKNAIALISNNIATHYMDAENYQQAEPMLMRALKIGQEIESPRLIQLSYENLSELYGALGDYQKAWQYLKDANKIKDEILNTEMQEKVAELQTRYETEKKEKEAEIYRLKNVELRNEIDRRKEAVRKLRRTNRKLKKINHEKNAILGIVSHELKNPLTSILGQARLVNQFGTNNFSTEDLNNIFETFETAAIRMFNLVKNLLDVYRLESGKLDVKMKLFDVSQVVQDEIEQFLDQAKAKNILIRPEFPPKSFYVYADEKLVKQVIDNLISNAIKYSPPQKNVYIRLFQNEKYIRLEVTDEGLGLVEDDYKKMFTKFGTLSAKPTAANEHSTGLGLFITRRLITAMDGRIGAESEGKNKGATFFVELKVGRDN